MPLHTDRVVVGVVLGVLALGFVSACSAEEGQGGTDLPSVSASVTRTLPSPTRSDVAPTRAPTSRVPETPTRQPEPSAQETTTRVSTVIAVPVPSSQPPEASVTSSPAPAEEAPVSTAAWVAIGLLVLAIIVGAWLFLRASKRRDWRTRLRAAQAEVSWFARDLLPQLRASGSAERVAGGWQVAVPRVVSAENRLTVLEASAPSQQDASRAGQLRDAVRVASTRMESLSGPGPHDEWALDLDDVQALLEVALGPAAVDDPSENPEHRPGRTS